MEQRTCAHCGAPLARKPKEPAINFRHRIYCGRKCCAEKQRADRARQTIGNFWSKADIRSAEECWEWKGTKQGAPDKDGRRYGAIQVGYKKLKASRVAWMLWTGAGPASHEHVLHKCDNPGCVNPHHLELGDNRKNIRDSFARGRRTLRKGEPLAKLKPEQVIEIRRIADGGALTRAAIARQFGVTTSAIREIISRRNWRRL